MTKSKSKQPEDQPKTTEQSESPAKPKMPAKASERRVPKGFTVVEDGESHIFIGGFPCPPPGKKPN
jgi:hypothetical protein